MIQVLSSAGFLFLWILIGRTDLNRQKIRNRYLRDAVWGIALGYGVQFALPLFAPVKYVGPCLRGEFYLASVQLVAICAGAALALWRLDVWPAGDAKLFILLSALYPLASPVVRAGEGRLVLSVLINAFIPASLAVFIQAGKYVLQTRLIHRRKFVIQLGWKKEMHFLIDGAKRAGNRVLDWRAHAPQAAREALARRREWTGPLVIWAIKTLSLVVFSYYLQRAMRSPLLTTVFWGCVFASWRRLETTARSSYIVAAAAVLFLGVVPGGMLDFAKHATLLLR